jgi:hypothetical protein
MAEKPRRLAPLGEEVSFDRYKVESVPYNSRNKIGAFVASHHEPKHYPVLRASPTGAMIAACSPNNTGRLEEGT